MTNRDVHPVTVATTRYSQLNAAFLQSLAEDLGRVGMASRLLRRGRFLDFSVVIKLPSPAKLRGLMRQEKARRLVTEKEFLKRVVANRLFNHFPGPDSVAIEPIRPEVVFCRTKTDFDLFRLCRLLQAVPAPRLLYRQIAALVVDSGQPKRPVMGAIGLASPIYSLKCRDAFFAWTEISQRKKQLGLASCMQLNVCVAVPPYNTLRGAKLMAALAATDTVEREYERRYRVPLLAVTTTSAMGAHSPVFNRFMIRPGGMYRKIGQTSGYSSLLFSSDTICAAKNLVRAKDGLCPSTTDRPIRTLKRALNLCGLPRERLLRLAFPKGVYVAFADAGSLAALRGIAKRQSKPRWPSVDDVIACWRTKELPKALNKLGVIDRLSCPTPSARNLLHRR